MGQVGRRGRARRAEPHRSRAGPARGRPGAHRTGDEPGAAALGRDAGARASRADAALHGTRRRRLCGGRPSAGRIPVRRGHGGAAAALRHPHRRAVPRLVRRQAVQRLSVAGTRSTTGRRALRHRQDGADRRARRAARYRRGARDARWRAAMPVTPETLEQAAGRARVRIEQRRRRADPHRLDRDHAREPATTTTASRASTSDAARWLAERGVAAVGADNFAVEPIPFPPEQRVPRPPAPDPRFRHRADRRPGAGAAGRGRSASFLFMATPLPVRGGTGSPLVPLAVL